jgi:hypothetical protein
MTDRDVLKRASDALRESTEPSAEELRELRLRVLGSQVVPLSRARRRNKTLRWVLPLAAAFIAGSALAASPGAWEGMLHSVERFLSVERLAPSQEASKKPKAGKRRPSVPAPPPLPAAPALPEPATPEAVVAEEVVAAAEPVVTPPLPAESAQSAAPRATAPTLPVRAKRTGVTGDTGTGTGTSTGTPAEIEARGRGTSQELALYRTAHELHFGAKRYEDALRAWESYLAQPAPTFALEARYNRALCLLRLGHYEEARVALRPYAEGRVLGGYRRHEAERLIEALDKRR